MVTLSNIVASTLRQLFANGKWQRIGPLLQSKSVNRSCEVKAIFVRTKFDPTLVVPLACGEERP